MAKYIDADLLRKEIEFAKSVYDNPKRVVAGVADAFMQDGRAAMCDDILKKIDSLQQKQPEKPVPAGLEEAAVGITDVLLEKPKDYALAAKADYWNGAYDGVIAGAKWQKGQMMQEAVEGTIDYVYDEKGDAYKAIRIDWLVGDFGDKVRVIVLPKDD